LLQAANFNVGGLQPEDDGVARSKDRSSYEQLTVKYDAIPEGKKATFHIKTEAATVDATGVKRGMRVTSVHKDMPKKLVTGSIIVAVDEIIVVDASYVETLALLKKGIRPCSLHFICPRLHHDGSGRPSEAETHHEDHVEH
jgi:hypothetical protein